MAQKIPVFLCKYGISFINWISRDYLKLPVDCCAIWVLGQIVTLCYPNNCCSKSDNNTHYINAKFDWVQEAGHIDQVGKRCKEDAWFKN